METVYVPPQFAILFIVPLVICFYVYEKTAHISLSVFVYLFLQISLAITARSIYG
tara:strand:+ start:1738 stop:1902 length:165 start_codon:yes stop_codon:yes gene_type:complete